ncbi:MAG TPA: bile acid:sodium symporter family protein [Pirellulales bacterium]|jgi:BASS family bile acid:Na+ symporter
MLQLVRKFCLAVAIVGLVTMAVGLVSGSSTVTRPVAVVAAVALAISFGEFPALRSYQFTAWIVAVVVAAMLYPEPLLQLNPDNKSLPLNKWIMLLVVQLVMFGMGTQMRLRDFALKGRMSYGVIIGLVLQFSIMPLVGWTIGRLAGFPPEIAAGMVLIGSCSSGLASNVMTYLAGGNLALSVTVTALGTLLAPLMTPLWMKVLAGELVKVEFFKMMTDITKLVVVPIGAAMLHDYLKFASPLGRKIVWLLAAVGFLTIAAMLCGVGDYLADRLSTDAMIAVTLGCFFLGAIVAGAIYHVLWARWPTIQCWMPRLSMCGIVYFTAITTAAGRDELLKIGMLLLAAVIVHNLIGYTLGYWLSRGAGLDVNSARTIALEVGIHNGAMASGIAIGMNKLATVGLPAAIFSPWMNVSGSILANYWRKRQRGEISQSPEQTSTESLAKS